MITETPHVTLTKVEAKKLRSEIKALVGKRTKGSMDLCRIVWTVSHAVVSVAGEVVFLWQLWGYKTWEDFLGLELSIHPTTAKNYRHIHQVFCVDLQGCWDEGNALPITKMRILAADKLTKRNVNAKLKRAAGRTCPQLVAEIYGVDELHSFSVSLSKSERNTVKRAIEKARHAFGSDGKKIPRGQVLARVMREWATIQDNVERNAKGRLRLVS